MTSSTTEPKPKKAKKRPSDFEIVRTILQRTHEYKLSYLFKNMGEDSDILFLCSCNEDDITYGSSDLSIGIFEFTDPELRSVVDTVLSKLKGYDTLHQIVINLKDQFAALVKTKGESIEGDMESNEYGSHWIVKTNIKGDTRTAYYAKAIDSLYHFQEVSAWCKTYRPLLDTQDEQYLYYGYTHTDTDTTSIVTLAPWHRPDHELAKLYPSGFRLAATKGLDVITGKAVVEFPYPVAQEELIIFKTDRHSTACQVAHRVVADGWRMVLLRPNAILFPTADKPIYSTGPHVL